MSLITHAQASKQLVKESTPHHILYVRCTLGVTNKSRHAVNGYPRVSFSLNLSLWVLVRAGRHRERESRDPVKLSCFRIGKRRNNTRSTLSYNLFPPSTPRYVHAVLPNDRVLPFPSPYSYNKRRFKYSRRQR